jgi:hypothetical protein
MYYYDVKTWLEVEPDEVEELFAMRPKVARKAKQAAAKRQAAVELQDETHPRREK